MGGHFCGDFVHAKRLGRLPVVSLACGPAEKRLQRLKVRKALSGNELPRSFSSVRSNKATAHCCS